MHQSLLDSVLASMVMLPAVYDDAATLSKFVDMNNFDFVDFLIPIGAIHADTEVNAKAQESVNADGSSASDITGAAITEITGSGDNVMVVISVAKSALTKRYVGVLVTTATGDGAAHAAIAIRYRKTGSEPVDQVEAGANSYATSQFVRKA